MILPIYSYFHLSFHKGTVEQGLAPAMPQPNTASIWVLTF